MKYVIIHGTFGNPDENWFPWLKDKLVDLWHSVWIPKLPTPESQTVKHWCDALQEQVPFVFDEETILIWHSLGATYLLHILDKERDVRVKKTIFVSWFAEKLWNEKFDQANKDFIEKDFDRDRIKNNTEDVLIFHWDDDPYVPLEKAMLLHKKLWWKIKIIPNWWHLNEEAGFLEFNDLFTNLFIK